MKHALAIKLLLAIPLSSQPMPPEDAPSFVNEGPINAPVSAVWSVFSTAEGYKALGVANADIDFRMGGLIRSHYDPKGVIGDENTIQNRILAYEPMRMVTIRIDRPPKNFPFKEAWKQTWTVISMTELGPNRTRLRIASMGFTGGAESTAMRKFFETGNAYTLKVLQQHFEPKEAKQ